MANNTHWSEKDMKDKGLILINGKYVPAKSQVAKGKVEKIQLPPDFLKVNTIGIVTNSGTTSMESMLPLIDEMQKNLVKASEKYIHDVVKSQQERAANKSYVHIGSDQVKFTIVNIKPLTQNRAWKGKRFKSDQYKTYATAVSLLLPKEISIPDGSLKIYYEFGMSVNSDFDNPVKMFTDILQEKYHFNDSRIMEANIRKFIVAKGQEYVKFKIEGL